MINYDMWAEQAIGKVSGEKKVTLVEIVLPSDKVFILYSRHLTDLQGRGREKLSYQNM